jgi:Carboxypeptidase regulatory-like domain
VSGAGTGSPNLLDYTGATGGGGGSTPPPPTTGSVAGKVTDAGTTAGIAGATVSAGATSTTTDASGNYTLAALTAGTYTVNASAAGYAPASQSVSVTAGTTSAANFALTKTTKSMWVQSISLRRTGNSERVDVKIAGTSGPVSGATVGVKVTSVSTGRVWNLSGRTDSTGLASFTIQKAPTGSYTATVTSLSATGYVWSS